MVGDEVGGCDGTRDNVGLIVGADVVGEAVGVLVIVGRSEGIEDWVGRLDGLVDNVGAIVGKNVGASPHSATDVHRMQMSILLVRIVSLFGLFDLYPLMHLHLGRNAFISIPDDFA